MFKKLLFVHNNTVNNYFNRGLQSGFKKFVPEYLEYSYDLTMVSRGRPEMNRELLQYATSASPDIIFLQHLDYGDILPGTIRELSRLCKCLISWSGDIMFDGIKPWYFDIAKAGAVSCFSNEDYVNEILKTGHPAYYFNHYCQEDYFPMNVPKTNKVVFIGSHYDRFPLNQERMGMVEFLYEKFGDDFKLYGNSWPKRIPHKFVGREESNLIYNHSMTAVNYSQINAERYSSDRLMHIMGSGCLCLSHYYPGAEKDLGEDGDAVCYFRDLNRLEDLVKYFSNPQNEKLRNEIASRGRDKVLKSFGDSNLEQVIKQIYLANGNNNIRETN